jgi:hypothetical protein
MQQAQQNPAYRPIGPSERDFVLKADEDAPFIQNGEVRLERSNPCLNLSEQSVPPLRPNTRSR